ncbi:MAG TPA: hypothetical protein VMF06_06870 [Candidatus Limnocylindria bacterium]|jgi:hypothetical protein|nr:hypothetical protein [Candidatus Limnocylindria bacterium]
MKTMEWCVPSGTLAEKDETGQAVSPGVGDTVTLTVEAKVNRVGGSNAYLTPLKINGTPVGTGDSGGQGPEDPPTRDELIAELQQADGNMS